MENDHTDKCDRQYKGDRNHHTPVILIEFFEFLFHVSPADRVHRVTKWIRGLKEVGTPVFVARRVLPLLFEVVPDIFERSFAFQQSKFPGAPIFIESISRKSKSHSPIACGLALLADASLEPNREVLGDFSASS